MKLFIYYIIKSYNKILYIKSLSVENVLACQSAALNCIKCCIIGLHIDNVAFCHILSDVEIQCQIL